jgi:hypothetical protein
MVEGEPAVLVETSCGKTFKLRASEMTDRQLKTLLEKNGRRTDVDPILISAMRNELNRRAAATVPNGGYSEPETT